MPTLNTTALADGEEVRLTDKFTLIHAPGSVTIETRGYGSGSPFTALPAVEVAPDVYLLDAPNGVATVRVTGGASTMVGIS